ncbi:MAG TPA: galactose oxidase-like domain-containing protein [Candidatus Eisenbacteria bacterium]|nr:galactose oxidase-like domain-containing protein [Candidatus Eisenbacteria bacterium]
MSSSQRVFLIASLSLVLCWSGGVTAATLSGVVRTSGALPVSGARITLFTPDLAVFLETRSRGSGDYDLNSVPAGSYRLGCAARGFDYVENEVVIAEPGSTTAFNLSPESHPGAWEVIGSTAPEFLDATDIAILLPDGRILYCHDTTDPVAFDPRTGGKTFPAGSGSAQGCMNGSLLADGSVILVGGQDGEDPGDFRNAVRWVKRFDPGPGTWTNLPDLVHASGRWYTGLARLADGSFLIMGGGTAPNAERTSTCERFDLITRTWSYTGSMLNPSEFSPSALLQNGKVLATWSPPQLYDPVSGQWQTTGNFNQPNRGWPGHSDHSLVVLADGRVVAVGVLGKQQGYSIMAEIYDPGPGTWTPVGSPGLVRFQSEVVPLPDGRIFVGGGETETSPSPVPSVLGIVRSCDLFDPIGNAWRQVADMPSFREYHAVTLLVPDGRVITTGGTRIKFQVGPTTADIEAFRPPYLYRGVRPRITSMSNLSPYRGSWITFQATPVTGITSAVLMGTPSTTHWVDGGIPRRLVLPVEQVGSFVTLRLPDDSNLLPLGHYMLFAMVDDIPSEAVIIQVKSPATTSVNGKLPLHLTGVSPNPFRSSVAFRYALGRPSVVRFEIADIRGCRVRTLIASEHVGEGAHETSWDGRDSARRRVAPGVYHFRMEANGARASGRVVLLP